MLVHGNWLEASEATQKILPDWSCWTGLAGLVLLDYAELTKLRFKNKYSKIALGLHQPLIANQTISQSALTPSFQLIFLPSS